MDNIVKVVSDLNSRAFLNDMGSWDGIALDIETTGIEFPPHKVLGIGLVGFNVDIHNPKATYEKSPNVYYVPIFKVEGTQTSFDDDMSYTLVDRSVLEELIQILNTRKYLAAHNLKFDLKGISTIMGEDSEIQFNPDPHAYIMDTLPCFRFISESGRSGEVSFSLDSLMERHLGEDYGAYKGDTTKLVTRAKCNDCKKSHKVFYKIPFPILAEYCGRDALAVIDLFIYLWDNYEDISFLLQYDVTKSLYEIERTGIRVDREYLTDKLGLVNEEYDKTYNILVQHINAYRNVIENYYEGTKEKLDFLNKFEPTNNNHVNKVLVPLGFNSEKKTEKRQENSWSIKTLSNIDHVIPALIVKLKKMDKFRSTFLLAYLDVDTIYPSYYNSVTVTGRLSSANPNIQQLPTGTLDFDDNIQIDDYNEFREYIQTITNSDLSGVSNEVLDVYKFFSTEHYTRKDSNLNIRSFFIPREDYNLVSIDYKQLEVCVLFYYIQNKDLLNYVRNGGDIHDMTTKLVFDLDKDTSDPDTFKQFRKMAKSITFGIIYGQGTSSLATKLGLEYMECSKLKDKFLAGIPGMRELINGINTTLNNREYEHGKGWIESIYGRRYYLTEDNRYTAINRIVQGSAGEFVNEKFVEVHKYLKGYRSNVLALIHDEILFEVHKDEMYLIDKIREIMVQNRFEIPLMTDAEVSTNSWAELEEYVPNKVLTNKNNTNSINSIDTTEQQEDVNMDTNVNNTLGEPVFTANSKVTVNQGSDYISFEIGVVGIPESRIDEEAKKLISRNRYFLGSLLAQHAPKAYVDLFAKYNPQAATANAGEGTTYTQRANKGQPTTARQVSRPQATAPARTAPAAAQPNVQQPQAQAQRPAPVSAPAATAPQAQQAQAPAVATTNQQAQAPQAQAPQPTAPAQPQAPANNNGQQSMNVGTNQGGQVTVVNRPTRVAPAVNAPQAQAPATAPQAQQPQVSEPAPQPSAEAIENLPW